MTVRVEKEEYSFSMHYLYGSESFLIERQAKIVLLPTLTIGT